MTAKGLAAKGLAAKGKTRNPKRTAFWLGAASLPLAGCVVSMPLGSLSASNEDATGSIPESALVRLLDPEDWRRAKAALSTALDPQGNGLPVGWDNPASGDKGSFTPVGKAYPSEAKVCRRFTSKVENKGEEHALKGIACLGKDGDWSIAEVKSATKA